MTYLDAWPCIAVGSSHACLTRTHHLLARHPGALRLQHLRGGAPGVRPRRPRGGWTSGTRDLRPFDFIIIGGSTFGCALAEHLWFRSAERGERILVLEAGPFALPEHVQNLPMLGLNAAGPRNDHSAQNEVWACLGTRAAFPGSPTWVGRRSVFWGGWSPTLLDSELRGAWPKAVLDDLRPAALSDGRKGYFRQAGDQIGVTETNDFIFGSLQRAMRGQLLEGSSTVKDAMPMASCRITRPSPTPRPRQPSFDDVRKRLMIVPCCHVLRLECAADERRRTPRLGRPHGTRALAHRKRRESHHRLRHHREHAACAAVLRQRGRIGRNLLAHLHSNVDIRVPRAALAALPGGADALEASALFVKGQHRGFAKPDGHTRRRRSLPFPGHRFRRRRGRDHSEAELSKRLPTSTPSRPTGRRATHTSSSRCAASAR